jgi:hypothetical protein
MHMETKCRMNGQRTVHTAESQERFKDYGARQPPHQSSLNGALAPRSYGDCSSTCPCSAPRLAQTRFHRRLWPKIKR